MQVVECRVLLSKHGGGPGRGRSPGLLLLAQGVCSGGGGRAVDSVCARWEGWLSMCGGAMQAGMLPIAAVRSAALHARAAASAVTTTRAVWPGAWALSPSLVLFPFREILLVCRRRLRYHKVAVALSSARHPRARIPPRAKAVCVSRLHAEKKRGRRIKDGK